MTVEKSFKMCNCTVRNNLNAKSFA